MTTIIYRDGSMYGDSRAYAGVYDSPIGCKQKVHRLIDGTLIGFSSNQVGLPDALIDHFKADRLFSEFPRGEFEKIDFSGLIVKPNGVAFKLMNNLLPSGPCYAPFYAIGSGSDFAYGAMTAGVGTLQAMRAAIECDVWSDWPVHRINHKTTDIETING